MHSSDALIQTLLPYIGLPENPHVMGGQQYESVPVTKLFEGKREYIQNGISAMLNESHNSFMTQYVLPLERHDDINFTVRKLDFTRTLAPQTAPQAAAPILQTSTTSESFSMNRYALTVFASAESLKTSEAQAILKGSLHNLAASFADSMEEAGFMELLERPQYYNVKYRLHGKRATLPEDIFAERNAIFDIVRKKERGIYKAIDHARNIMTDIIPTDIIVPEFVASLVAGQPAEQEYYRAGPDARDAVKLGADSVLPVMAGGLRVHVARSFAVDNGRALIDPLGSDVTLGDHVRFDDFSKCKLGFPYDSCQRRIFGFDMSMAGGGGFAPLEAIDAIRHSERWDDSDLGHLSPLHEELANNASDMLRKAGIAVHRGQNIDPFLYQTQDGAYHVCSLIGHQEESALQYSDLRAVADSLYMHQLRSLNAEDVKALQDGARLIEQLYSRTLQAEDVPAIVAAANAGRGRFGAPEVPANNNNPLPAGFGTVAGVRSIALLEGAANTRNVSPAVIERAARFNRALEKLHSATSAVFVDTHPALDPAMVPTAFKSTLGGFAGRKQDSITAMAQNLLDGNKLALFWTPNVPGAGQQQWEEGDTDNVAIDAARALLSQNTTPGVRGAFGTLAGTQEFARKFARSRFAAAYAEEQAAMQPPARRLRGRNDGEDADLDTSLATFLQNEINEREGVQAQSIMAAAVDLVNRGSAPNTRSVSEWIEARASVSPPGLKFATDTDGAIATGLAVPISQGSVLAGGAGDGVLAGGAFAVASPYNPGEQISIANLDNVREAQENSVRDPAQLTVFSRFPISRSGAPAGGAGVGRKRQTYTEEFGGPGLSQQPSFFDPYMREGGSDGKMHLNRNLTERYARAAREERDPLRRAAMHLIMLAPICLRTYELFNNNNIRMPLAVLAERPLRYYHTSAIIILRGGKDLGITAYTGIDAHLGANATNKTFSIHVSMWFVPIVKNPENLLVLRNAVVQGYGGGEDWVPFAADTFRVDDTDAPGSVFYFATNYGSLRDGGPVPKTHDIRGRFDDDVIETRLDRGAQESARKLHYPGALYYELVYGFSSFRPQRMEEMDVYRPGRHGRTENTITQQSMQYLFNPVTGGHDQFFINTDPFGPDVYPGHGYVRSGNWSETYKQMNYESMHRPIN